MACHQRLGKAHTEERREAWHEIIIFGQHTRLNYVGLGMPSSPLGSTRGRTTTGMACHHHLWAAHTVDRRRVWHAIIALWQHTQSKDVRCGMTSLLLDSTHGRTTSGVACYHRLWAAHTIERRLAGHAIIAHGRQTRLNDVRRDMPSPSLDSTHGLTTSGMACYHRL